MTENEYFSFRNISPEYYSDFRLPKYLLAVLPENKDAKILDIGCGFGQMLKCLRSEGYPNTYGIDISKEAVKYCKSTGLNVEEIFGLEEYSDGRHGTFDLIIMSHILEHIEKQKIIETLSIVKKRLLSENGKLLVMVPNAQSNTGSYWAYEDFTHTTIFTAGSLFYVLKAAGFEHIKYLDPQYVEGLSPVRRIIKKTLLKIYIMNKEFWNRITGSSYHKPSPRIFGFEIRALAM
jgi:2-polyprenyl-3-methyl-5-hydroxy-6-metoxy-1,4-benzoquinol methylase